MWRKKSLTSRPGSLEILCNNDVTFKVFCTQIEGMG